jgi:hypothetical protein
VTAGAALAVSLLVVPGWLTAAPTGAPAMMVPPARTLPTGPLLAWDGSTAPAVLGDFVWCEGDAETGGCRGFNADDFAITYWVRQNVIDPYLEANPQWTPAAASPSPSGSEPSPSATPSPAPTATPSASPAPSATATAAPTASPAPAPTPVVCLEGTLAAGKLICTLTEEPGR